MDIRDALGKISPENSNMKGDELRNNLMKQFRPQTDIDFRNLFTKWINQFHEKYLSLPRKKDYKELFYKVFHI